MENQNSPQSTDQSLSIKKKLDFKRYRMYMSSSSLPYECKEFISTILKKTIEPKFVIPGAQNIPGLHNLSEYELEILQDLRIVIGNEEKEELIKG